MTQSLKKSDNDNPIINLSLQVLPLVEEGSLYSVVDAVIDMIRKSGVKYIVGPMETTMEGPMDVLFDIAQKSHHVCVQNGALRVATVIKTDFSPKGMTIDEKLEKYQ